MLAAGDAAGVFAFDGIDAGALKLGRKRQRHDALEFQFQGERHAWRRLIDDPLRELIGDGERCVWVSLDLRQELNSQRKESAYCREVQGFVSE